MTDLTETQRTILAAAAVRPGMRVLPLPDHIKGGAANKVLGALLARGLVEETNALACEATTLRDGVTLIATAAAFRALAIVPANEKPAAASREPEPDPVIRPTIRAGTKQAQLIAMLQRPHGATIDEIVSATGWQPHTVRGAIAGALKKRLGMEISSDKVDGRGRVYRAAD